MVVFEERIGSDRIEIVHADEGYSGVVHVDGISSPSIYDGDMARLKRRLRHVTEAPNPGYLGMTCALRRFFAVYPQGFSDLGYLQDERDHKVMASARLGATLPLSLARKATAQQAASLIPIFDTGILPDSEFSVVSSVLAGPGGTQFVRGAASFADGRYSEGLRAMEASFRSSGMASWAMATYLPWLWMPADHILLQPDVCRDFARRVGHDFDHEYESRLFPDVYRSMLDLCRWTSGVLADASPADRIDIQGFIWIVGRAEAVL